MANIQNAISFSGGSLKSAAAIPSSASLSSDASAADAPPNGKLLYKLLPVFLSLSLVPLVIVGYLLIRVAEERVQVESRGVKLEVAQKVGSNVDSYIQDLRNILQVVNKSSDFLSMKTQPQSEFLDNVMISYPMFMRMTVVDLNGRAVSTVNRVPGRRGAAVELDEVQALRSVRARGDYIGPVSRSVDGYPQMTMAVPVERTPGHPIGALLAVVNLLDLSSLVRDLTVGRSGHVVIVDMATRQILAHPDVQMLLSAQPAPELKALKYAPDDIPSGAFVFADDQNRKFLDTYATFTDKNKWINWRVLVQQPLEEAYEASNRMRRQITIAFLFAILITTSVAAWISKVIVRRVQTLQHAMEQVGEGNFDIPKVATSNDEFGSLADKFLWMARSLKDKTLKLVSAQKELQKWTSELERRVDQRTKDLKEAQDQLIQHEKLAALGQMASVVGHELRNPLAVMNNSVYFLKTKLGPGAPQVDPKVDKHLHILESEIAKSNMIIRDVLDFARNRALNAIPRNVDELVEKATERIQLPPGVVLSKSLTLKNLEVPVDEDEIRQVLVNLMENACQAMTSGGTLYLGTKSYNEAGTVEITIGDSGCGIPQEHLNKIFAPFYTTKSRGTGLGLAVVKKIIERHHGTILVDSKVGEGTQFHIKLPIKSAAVGQTPASQPGKAVSGG